MHHLTTRSLLEYFGMKMFINPNHHHFVVYMFLLFTHEKQLISGGHDVSGVTTYHQLQTTTGDHSG